MKVRDFIKFLKENLDPEEELTYKGKNFTVDSECVKNSEVWTCNYETQTIFCKKRDSVELFFQEVSPSSFIWDCDGHITYKGLPQFSKQVQDWVRSYWKFEDEVREEEAAYSRLDIDQVVDYLLEHKKEIWWVDEWNDCMNYIRKRSAGVLDKWLPFDDPEAKHWQGSAIMNGSVSNYFLNNHSRETIKELIQDFFPRRPTYLNCVFYTEKSPYGSRTEKALLVDKPRFLV